MARLNIRQRVHFGPCTAPAFCSALCQLYLAAGAGAGQAQVFALSWASHSWPHLHKNAIRNRASATFGFPREETPIQGAPATGKTALVHPVPGMIRAAAGTARQPALPAAELCQLSVELEACILDSWQCIKDLALSPSTLAALQLRAIKQGTPSFHQLPSVQNVLQHLAA